MHKKLLKRGVSGQSDDHCCAPTVRQGHIDGRTFMLAHVNPELAAMTPTDVESLVIHWIAEWSGRNFQELSPKTSINIGPRCLGVDGDDAYELLEHLHHKTGVLFDDDFAFDNYFGPEGFGIDRSQIKKRKLTIEMLAQYISAKMEGPKGND